MTATSNDRVASGGAAVADEVPALGPPVLDRSTAWTPRRAANGPRRRGALAEAGGWVLVGLMNAVSVASQTPERTWGGRLLHHAVDLAHFALLGCAAALLVTLDKVLARLRVPRAVRILLALALFTLAGRFVLTADLANLLLRFEPPVWLPVHELVAFVLAGLYLVWRERTRALSRRVPGWAMAALFLGLVLATAWLLPSDYPGTLLLAAACSARVGSLLLLDRRRTQLASSRQLALALGAVTLLLVPAFFARPGGRVWRSVLRVPTAVAAPFLSRLFASKDAVASAWIHSKHPEWLRSRRNAPDKPSRGPRPAIAGSPLVILFTIDSLRADVLASGKYDDSLPTLAKLRDESYYFTLARSAASSTVPSFASIFSGKLYSELDWSHPRVLPIDDPTERWPARLSENGVVTINAPCLKVLRGNAGIAAGFTIERQTPRDWATSWNTAKLLLPELEKLGDRPGFAFAHMLDAHSPHTMAKKKGTVFERYVAEVGLVDTTLRKLRAFLEERGLAKRTILIVSADHGEGFGEHGLGQHGRTTYEELLRVPLIIHVPGATPKRIDAPVTLMDLGPTILDIFALPAPGHIRGQSLLPLMAGKPYQPMWPIAAESTRRVQSLLYPDGIKGVRDVANGTLEVYDLKNDPGEQHDLNGSPDFPHARYTAGVVEFFETHTFRKPGYEVPWRKF